MEVFVDKWYLLCWILWFMNWCPLAVFKLRNQWGFTSGAECLWVHHCLMTWSLSPVVQVECSEEGLMPSGLRRYLETRNNLSSFGTTKCAWAWSSGGRRKHNQLQFGWRTLLRECCSVYWSSAFRDALFVPDLVWCCLFTFTLAIVVALFKWTVKCVKASMYTTEFEI